MENKARTNYAKKNVVYNVLTYVFLMVLTFVSRKVLLSVLGDQIGGLESFLKEALNFLNLVESGVGTAILFALYKPFKDKNRSEIKSLVTLFSKIYKICGTVVLISSIILLPFLKFFMKQGAEVNGNLDTTYMQICFMLFVIDTVITYYFSYKICLLNASQNLYIVTFWDFVCKSLKIFLQILVIYSFKSFVMYIGCQIITNILYLIIINKIINKKFQWFKEEKIIEVKSKNSILRNIKALFLHKIGGFVVFSTDNLLVTYFFGLVKVALVQNYNLIISFCKNLMNKIFEAISPGIGNLLVEGDNKRSFLVFKRLFFFNFWMSSFVTMSLYNCIDSFIRLWIGKRYIMDSNIVIIILVNFYINTMRMTADKFKEGAGLYYEDRYAPIAEAFINLISSIILANKIGISGIFLGTLISNLSVVFWLKPKIVFNKVFNKSFFQYLKYYLAYTMCAVVPFLLCSFCFKLITFNSNLINLFFRIMISVIVINGSYIIMFYRKDEFKYYVNTLLKKGVGGL
ncbi:Membrane protein involved in the export of O-antigen and teichoic acid [Hathewaya proteolytica DSM 3090]|uniref:Membrane protein involved in the export of O-antigen and teichoic acid n=1 Tax=Hathewaya proteolytica DSM 3090 TaxID=1121331 RepID=A0A1M6PSV5_9CLOT|nr:hypothetical protein [Hathewaya proteolytica]SHK11005.1 Membrane protein involved in the export of O-antigen and teichoic acid [Hathewaya proteolytica DSM 3090]